MRADRLAELRDLDPSRVCLIKPSSLGDVVHALPTLASLRDLWPRAHLAWVVNQGLRGLLDGHPDLDEVIPFDRGSITPGPRGMARFAGFLRQLHARRFDVVIDLQGLLRSGLMAGATGARVRVGRADAREGSRRFYTHQVSSTGPETHAVDRLLGVAVAFGADASRPRFVVAKTPEDVQWARSVLEGVPRPVVALNPGARWLTKRWPPERFAEVARRTADQRGAGIVVLGAAEDRPLADAILQALGTTPALDLCGRTRLPQLAALAGEVDVFLSNDTGPLHLAAAAGARTVGVYTCTSPGRTGPYGAASIAVQSCVWCSPSFIKNCDRLECMTELTSERVWKAVERQLSDRIMAA